MPSTKWCRHYTNEKASDTHAIIISFHQEGKATWRARYWLTGARELRELGLGPGPFQPKSPLDLYPELLSSGQVHTLQLGLPEVTILTFLL